MRLFLCLIAFITLAHPVTSASDFAATIGSKQISFSELDGRDGRVFRLASELYAARKEILNKLIAEELLRLEAGARSITVQELEDVEITSKATPVTDDEVERIYRSIAARLKTVDRSIEVQRIHEAVHSARLRERRNSFLRELESKYKPHIFLEAPRTTLDLSNRPQRGSQRASIVVVEFADFQCPFSRSVSGLLNQLEREYPNELRRVFLHFPLQSHTQAGAAAEAAACAGRQGKFWEMYQALFAMWDGVQPLNVQAQATLLDLDVDSFTDCVAGHLERSTWERDKTEGIRQGVSQTPTIFVNGRMITGLIDLNRLREETRDELSRVSNVSPASSKR